MPGYLALHGCIGLYDEPMQKDSELNDAQRFYDWVLGSEPDADHEIPLPNGPRIQIIGQAPRSER